jgi:DNA invertase Pin-like site-specific DNA recombinase
MISAAIRRAYSYVRFSTAEQRKGDSLARQEKLRTAWLACNPEFVLDHTLKLQDLGVSAFKGKNATDGKLAAFIAAVEDGRVEPGSVLLVESLDRLSRDQIGDALQLFLRLLGAGITIVTLSPDEERFDKSSINDVVKIITVLVVMSRAHEESATKSKRIAAARKKARNAAREDGKTLTKQLPAWVEATKDGKRVEIPAAADTVRLIFDLAADGMSTRKIEAKLNATAKAASPKQRNGWRRSYIKKILYNRAVLGEYQPHTRTETGRVPVGEAIQGYFPAIVAPDVFYKVQQRLAGNRGKGGRTGAASNVLTHLVKCAYCGGAMRFEDKGKPPKGRKYLTCDNGVRGVRDEQGSLKCSRHRVRYDECLELILYNCRRLRPGDVLPKADDQDKLVRALQTQLAGTAARLAEIETKLGNLTERVGDAPSKDAADRVYKLIDAKEQEKAALLAEQTAAAAALRKAETSTRSFVEWRDDLDALNDAIETGGPEIRLRLRSHLREFIDRIEVFAVGTTEPDDWPATTWAGAKPIVAWNKTFERKLREPKPSRDYLKGRFYRVHFQSGTVVEFIPNAVKCGT